MDRGFSYDVVDAVLNTANGNINEIMLRAEAVRASKNAPFWEDLMVVYNRCFNLTKKWTKSEVEANDLIDPTEIDLYKQYQQVKPGIEQAVAEMCFIEAMAELAKLRPAIDQFFNAVMVMVDDEKLRSARLGILKSVADLCNSVADLSKVVS